MSAGSKRTPNADEENIDEAAMVDGGPGLAYMPFVVMEDLLDKLKLLNYEEVSQFISESRFKGHFDAFCLVN